MANNQRLSAEQGKIMLDQAKEVCPTNTRNLVSQGALLVDVRELSEVQALAFDVPDIVNIPLSELEQRSGANYLRNNKSSWYVRKVDAV